MKITKMLAAALVAATIAGTATACGGSSPDPTACRAAMSDSYAKSLVGGTPPGNALDACKGLPGAELQQLAGQVVESSLPTAAPAPTCDGQALFDRVNSDLDVVTADQGAQLDAAAQQLDADATAAMNCPLPDLTADQARHYQAGMSALSMAAEAVQFEDTEAAQADLTTAEHELSKAKP